ncbi:glycoside hydrolase family 3 protein [bacterium]|nr:glycoside hydrolase family 3 protein [bacterium]
MTLRVTNIFLVIISLLILLLAGCSNSPTESEPEDEILNFKIGQMVMIGFRGTELTDTNHVRSDIRELHIGGVVLYDLDVPDGVSYPRNIESPEQLSGLVSDLQDLDTIPLLVAIDQEGGIITRLKESYGFPATVSHQHLGDVNDPDTTHYWAGVIAATLQEMGINMNFAPVVDLNVNPDCPVIGHYERSFSADQDTVTFHASIFIEEHHDRGVRCTVKHFPGHGSSTEDTHMEMADVTETWSAVELEPYANIISAGDCDAVMTAHIFNSHLDPNYPATLSENIITGILRDSLDFDGVVISDDMQMGAIVENFGFETAIELAIKAGVDILLFSNNSSEYSADIAEQAINVIKNLIGDGEITEERIEESYQRIRLLKQGAVVL